MFSLTLTGADQWTDTGELTGQTGVEFGLLYSCSNTSNRYPKVKRLLQLARLLPNPALHVCGSLARVEMWRRSSEFLKLAAEVRRIQVNGFITHEALHELLERYPDHVIITQHCPDNLHLAESWHKRHAILVDGSGGRGILPEKWEQPETQRPVGFAGGLTPDNLRDQLCKLRQLRPHSWWVDMETGLRTNDRFDVAKALAAIETFRAWKHQVLQARSERVHTLHSI